jgi:serine O-acetyltransferase
MTIKNLIQDISADISFDRQWNHRAPSKIDWVRAFFLPQTCCLLIYRISYYLNQNNWKLLSKILRNINIILFGIDIQPDAQIMGGCFIGHTVGVVIGPKVFIDKHCSIFNGVTISASRIPGEEIKDFLYIGKNVRIYAGAKIFGELKIGDNVTIAANSLVLKSIRSGSTVGGIPATPII